MVSCPSAPEFPGSSSGGKPGGSALAPSSCGPLGTAARSPPQAQPFFCTLCSPCSPTLQKSFQKQRRHRQVARTSESRGAGTQGDRPSLSPLCLTTLPITVFIAVILLQIRFPASQLWREDKNGKHTDMPETLAPAMECHHRETKSCLTFPIFYCL